MPIEVGIARISSGLDYGCLERKTERKKTKYNVTSVARISNQSVPNHASEDMIFIAIPLAIYHIP